MAGAGPTRQARVTRDSVPNRAVAEPVTGTRSRRIRHPGQVRLELYCGAAANAADRSMPSHCASRRRPPLNSLYFLT